MTEIGSGIGTGKGDQAIEIESGTGGILTEIETSTEGRAIPMAEVETMTIGRPGETIAGTALGLEIMGILGGTSSRTTPRRGRTATVIGPPLPPEDR